MRYRSLVLLPLLSTLAWADPASVNDSPYQVPPRSKGAPHVCLTNYPVSAVSKGHQGVTELLFDVTTDGTVEGVIVAASSGYSELDFASTSCSFDWRYQPAHDNGKPVEASWEAHVKWTLRKRDGSWEIVENRAPQPRLPAMNCVLSHADAADKARASHTPITVVRYTLVNGDVADAQVEEHSSDPALDDYAVSCVKTWHFHPVNDAGVPATGQYFAIIDWIQETVRRKPL